MQESTARSLDRDIAVSGLHPALAAQHPARRNPAGLDERPLALVHPRRDPGPTILEPEIARFITAELRRWAGSRRTVILTVPARRLDPENLLAVSRAREAFLWDPGHGTVWAGAGAAHRIDPVGAERFSSLRRQARRLASRLVTVAYAGGLPDRPRFFGGLAFAPGNAEPAWSSFGDGCFVLPRVTVCRRGPRVFASLALRGEAILDPEDETARFDHLLARLAAFTPEALSPGMRPPGMRPPEPADEDRPRLLREIAATRDAILEGRLDKVVVAGRSRVTSPCDASAVLRRLAGLPGCTRFAFRQGGTTFLGATPERLIVQRGRYLSTEALAGTIGPGDGRAEELAKSTKDRREHRLVVDEIERRLRPFCSELHRPGCPRVVTLRHLMHLSTPFTGTLASPRHVLDLVETLHPTPAVGGAPTREALRWIRRHEKHGRGWYASPVGWFDTAGDGDFRVALRSALLSDREAWVYAGAGIVAASDPAREVQEIELKQQTLLAALGCRA